MAGYTLFIMSTTDLRDNKYNFMKKKLMHSVHNIFEQA